MKIEKIDYLIIICLFSIAFLIRIIGASSVPLVFGDEGLYWSKAILILENNWKPIPLVFNYPSPLLSHILAAVILLFGGELNTLRIVSVVFGSLTVPFMFLFGKEMYDRKTGFLSALFLTFSAYHILYSRLIMLEAFTLFFVTGFLYFFWLSQHATDSKHTLYTIAAGSMLGLAIDAKYLPAIFIPILLIYTFFTRRFSFRAVLLDKRIILTITFAILLFIPMVVGWFYAGIGLEPLLAPTINKYARGVQIESTTRLVGLPMDELLTRATTKPIEAISWGAQILSPFLRDIFSFSVFLLSIITFFYFLLLFIRRDKKASFLMVSILFIIIVLMVMSPAKYYLMYAFPLFFVMLSRLILKSLELVRIENNYKNIFRLPIVLLAVIMLFFYVITSVTSSYWDKGENTWAKSSIDFIQGDVAKSGDKGHMLIGWFTGLYNSQYYIDYYLYYFSNLNASTVKIWKVESHRQTMDLQKVNTTKPDYLIMKDYLMSSAFKGSMKEDILNDYDVIFRSTPYASYICGLPDSDCGLVLKRKDMVTLEPPQNDSSKVEIYKDIFNISVPSMMNVGKTYTALVKIKNIGDSRTPFQVNINSKEFIMFVDPNQSSVTLDEGSSSMLKFKLVPMQRYTSKLPVTVNVYDKTNKSEFNNETVESLTTYVYLIK